MKSQHFRWNPTSFSCLLTGPYLDCGEQVVKACAGHSATRRCARHGGSGSRGRSASVSSNMASWETPNMFHYQTLRIFIWEISLLTELDGFLYGKFHYTWNWHFSPSKMDAFINGKKHQLKLGNFQQGISHHAKDLNISPQEFLTSDLFESRDQQISPFFQDWHYWAFHM